MFPRHSRAHPFVIRIRSFACTRSISSFRSSCMEDSGCASSGSDGRSSATLREPEILSTDEIKLITSAPDILGVDRLNRIKVVSEVAELVPILRAVDSDVKAEVFREVSAGWMTVREIEAKFGEEGA